METEVKSSKAVLEKISNTAAGFMGSKWSLMIFPTAVFIFGIINYFMFGLHPDTFSITVPWVSGGKVYSSDADAWIGWFEITIATLGSTLTIFGVILTIRFDKRFVVPLVVGEIFVVIDAIIVGYIFTGLSYVLMAMAGVYSYIQWGKEEEDMSNKMNMKLWIFVGIAFSLYAIVGIGILAAFPTLNASFDEAGNITHTSINNYWAWLDVFCSGIVTASWFIMLRKCKWAFIGFISTDILYLVMYFAVHVWATGASYAVYLCIDSTSFMSWITKD